MQGQKGTVGSFPDSFNFDQGSSSGNTAIDPQIFWNNMRNQTEARLPDYMLSASANISYVNPVGFDRQNLNGWRVGEPSSTNTQQDVNIDERRGDCGWPTLAHAYAGDPRVGQRQYELTNILSLENANANANSLLIEVANSATSPQSLNLNAAVAPADGHEPFILHPGGSGFLVEENNSRAGSSSEGRRVSHKRKAVDASVGQSSVSGSDRYFQHAESSMWPPVPVQCNVGGTSIPPQQLNPRRELGSRRVSSDSCPDWSTIRNAESSQRSTRLRVNPPNQDSVTHLFSTANAVRRPSGSSSQRLPRLPVNQALNFRSAAVIDDTNSQGQSAAIHVPVFPLNEQLFSWNGSLSSRTTSSSNSSSNSSIPGDRDNVSQEEAWPRHILPHPMFIPAPQLRSLVHNPTNSSLPGGNVSVAGNVASVSRTGGSRSAMRPLSAPSWAPNGNPPSRYTRRLSEYVRQSLHSSVGSEAAGQSAHNSSLRSGLPASSQDTARASGAGNPVHQHPYARLASLAERQGGGILGFPHSLRNLAAARDREGRRRIASEIRTVLDLMRRGEGLRFEDFMMLNQSVIFGAAGIHDRHRDMRLDVDNMSYEELLALEERIGNVCTGLKEETISSRLKQTKYSSECARAEAEPCCVCQEEYSDGEDVGTLECGHDFHRECIKQWLMQKNVCPICKMPGLSTT